MASGIKFLLAVLLLITGGTTHLYSRDQPAVVNPQDTVKTVIIYSSKNSFYEDYPVSSLVRFLNSLNTNKNIIYKIIQDSSKTNYLIDLDSWMKSPKNTIGGIEKVNITLPKEVNVLNADGTYRKEFKW